MIREAEPWCVQRLGPNARRRLVEDCIIDIDGRWANLGRQFWFRDAADHAYFSRRWD